MAIDATVSGAASNSYATQLEATEYHAGRLWSDEWAAASELKREAALRYATAMIDRFDFEPVSEKAVSTQRLRWPRLYVYDMDGERLTITAIPAPIRDACCELAYFLLVDDRTAEQGVPEFKSLNVGPIGIEFNARPSHTSPKPTLPRSVAEILRPYLVGYGQTRIVRG